MKDWVVTDIRWANLRDLQLPFWQKWNSAHRLPHGNWKRTWEYPFICSKIPFGRQSPDSWDDGDQTVPENDNPRINPDLPTTTTTRNAFESRENPPKKRIISANSKTLSGNDNSYDYIFHLSQEEEIPELFPTLTEMIRVAKYRIVITLAISDKQGIPLEKLRDLEKKLNIRIPPLPADALHSNQKAIKKFHQNIVGNDHHIRILGFTIDSRDMPKSVGIIIPHWNSWPFLKMCLENIQKNRNPALSETTYVIDDASDDGSYEKAKDYFRTDPSIQFHQVYRKSKKDDADVGYLLDYGVGIVQEQYVAMIDADIVPLSRDWLSFPIWIQERYQCSSVGMDSSLSNCYVNRVRGQYWWQPPERYHSRAGLFDNQWFSHTNNLYRIMNTALAKVVSDSIGFTRWCPNRGSLINRIYRAGKDIIRLQVLNKRYPYYPGCEDNGVAASHFLDINMFGPKFNIPQTSYIGVTPSDGPFGQNISGLIFHFVLSTRALSSERREVSDAGKDYYYWVNRMQEQLDDQLVQELIEASKPFKESWFSPPLPASWYEQEFRYIQELIEEYHLESSQPGKKAI